MDKGLENEVRNIQTKAGYSEDWKKLVAQIQEYMSETRRTWGNAIMVLLEAGLKAHTDKENK